MQQKPRNSYFDTYYNATRRTLRSRLLRPLLRSKHPPEYTARGVMIGLVVALTPTIGIQMFICAAIWGLVRLLVPRWDFNLIIAMAWTWITNVLTAAPIYYLFAITGQFMLGRWHRTPASPEAFDAWFEQTTEIGDAGKLESLWTQTIDLFETFGLPMFVGSIPWAIAVGWIGYVWSLRMLRRIRKIRRERLLARHRRQRATTENAVAEKGRG